jgi:hypothetical protein
MAPRFPGDLQLRVLHGLLLGDIDVLQRVVQQSVFYWIRVVDVFANQIANHATRECDAVRG